MGARRTRIGAALAVAAIAQVLSAQPTPEIPRVEILGASVSAGYMDLRLRKDGEPNDTVPLLRALRHIWPNETATVVTRAHMAMFSDPQGLGERQVRQALRGQPDLVVAVDFLFWFGYGTVGGGDRGRQSRLQLQAKGLELLDNLNCPIILGDYPDMSGADARILPPRMIPDNETLDELNRRLLAWAEERPRVHLFPLARWVKQLVEEGYPIPLEKGPVHTPPLYLLQSDRLHATRLGMALLGFQVQGLARRALPESHPLVGDPVSIDILIEAIGAEGDLEGIKKVPAKAGRDPRRAPAAPLLAPATILPSFPFRGSVPLPGRGCGSRRSRSGCNGPRS